MMFYDHIFIDVYQYLVKLTRLFLSSSFSDKRYYAEFGLIDVSIVFFFSNIGVFLPFSFVLGGCHFPSIDLIFISAIIYKCDMFQICFKFLKLSFSAFHCCCGLQGKAALLWDN